MGDVTPREKAPYDALKAALAQGCSHCGEPVREGEPVHTVMHGDTGLTVWFHGTGVCNVVANGGSPLPGEENA